MKGNKIHNKNSEIKKLRKMLWLAHGSLGHCLYGDDGEMQCNTCFIDFKRSTIEEIENRMQDILFDSFKKDVK